MSEQSVDEADGKVYQRMVCPDCGKDVDVYRSDDPSVFCPDCIRRLQGVRDE